MKNKFFYIIVGITALFVSCNDYLDVDPTQRAKLETPEDISKLLANAYPKASEMQFMEFMSDNVNDNQKWFSMGSSLASMIERQSAQSFFWEDVDDTDQDTPTNYWNACYEAIAVANLAIQFIETSDRPERFSAQMGEALLCRAYAHFMLAVFFSKPYNPASAQTDLGIPYVTEPETVVFADYKRETLAKAYELIETDLLKGLPMIDDGSYSVRKYHFNKVAANAFAARFFLFKQDWGKVITYATEALGISEASLLRDWNGEKGYNSLAAEALGGAYTNYQEAANLLMCEKISWYPFFTGFRYILTKDISNEIYGSMGNYNVTGGSYAATPGLSWQGGVNEAFIPKLKEWWKYASINSQTGHTYLMQPLLTAEETLLNRAEAYAMSGDTAGVCKDLNIFYSKRINNYNNTTDSITIAKINSFARSLPNILSPVGYMIADDSIMNQVKVIVDTRRKEFIHEGNRWFDIKRFNIEITHTSYDGTRKETLKKDDLRRELQIPQDAIAFGITPNPRSKGQ